MFSSIFGKRRSSPVEESDTPPIPGAKSDEGYVMIEPASRQVGIYPNVISAGQGAGSPYPGRPAPGIPAITKKNSTDQCFNYMQGVPFSLSRELQMATNKDGFAIAIGDLLAFVTNKINLNSQEYDFSIEKSVLKEC